MMDYLMLCLGDPVMFRMRIREGFTGQIHYVIPRHFLQEVKKHPLLHALFPTDIGWYPQARFHFRDRPAGTPEYILIYCVAGQGWATLHGETLTLNAGEALLIPRDEPHKYGASLDAPWSIHWLHFRGEIAYQFMQQMPAGQFRISVHERAQAPIVETFRECYEVLDSDFTMRQMIFVALAMQRILAWVFFANPDFQPSATDMPEAIYRVLSYMRDTLDQRHSLADLAEHAGLSASHFSYLFKAHLGMSPMDYFIQLKMQYACHLLETSRTRVRDIAYDLAYEDPYYFSRLFRKVIGISPGHYRKKFGDKTYSTHHQGE